MAENDEAEANYFALNLLMPADFLREDMRGIQIDLADDGDIQLKRLARKYAVGERLMLFRLVQLGLMDSSRGKVKRIAKQAD